MHRFMPPLPASLRKPPRSTDQSLNGSLRDLIRDAAFSIAVKAAYQETCAITGFKIINSGGRAEVQAAHIRPVADRGPDSLRNGIALCGTMHWMFDRGLISIDDD